MVPAPIPPPWRERPRSPTRSATSDPLPARGRRADAGRRSAHPCRHARCRDRDPGLQRAAPAPAAAAGARRELAVPPRPRYRARLGARGDVRGWPRSGVPRAMRDFADFREISRLLARAADVPDYTWFWWKLRPHPGWARSRSARSTRRLRSRYGRSRRACPLPRPRCRRGASRARPARSCSRKASSAPPASGSRPAARTPTVDCARSPSYWTTRARATRHAAELGARTSSRACPSCWRAAAAPVPARCQRDRRDRRRRQPTDRAHLGPAKLLALLSLLDTWFTLDYEPQPASGGISAVTNRLRPRPSLPVAGHPACWRRPDTSTCISGRFDPDLPGLAPLGSSC